MNGLTAGRRGWPQPVGFAIRVIVYATCLIGLRGADTHAPVAKVAEIKAEAIAPAKKSEKKTLSGAELYSMHCNRCHSERYPNERTAAQWKTIVLHMRVRANLPARDAKAILRYMQDNSGY